MAKKSWQKLYKRTSTGEEQEWSVSVEGATIVTRYGRVGGKIQEARDTLREGKNLGKKNATTAEQQAEVEAEALWTKKLKKGYTKDLASAMAGETDALIKGGVLPMLASQFADYSDRIVYPCFGQPKYDGFRCVARVVDGKASLWTRTRKPYEPVFSLVRSALEKAFRGQTIDVDGELYIHGVEFSQLSEYIKNGDSRVEYWAYDLIDLEDTFQRRWQRLSETLKDPSKPIVLSATKQLGDEDDVTLYYESCLENGYEGIMVRQAAGLYKSSSSRSRDLLKLKQFLDDEFEVVNVIEGRGKMAGHAIFVCMTKGGVVFNAKMKGPHAELAKYLERPQDHFGKFLTVKYQNLTKYGAPRCPVALRFRERP